MNGKTHENLNWCRKSIWQNSIPCHKNTQLGLEENYLKTIEVTYEKDTANIIVNGEKTESFSLITQECPFSSLLFNITLEVPARIIRQEREVKSIQIGKEVNISLFTDDILYVENPRDSTKKKSISKFSKVAEYKVNTQQSIAFLSTNEKWSEKEII